MKKSYMITFALLSSLLGGVAQASVKDLALPYVGIDAQMRHMSLKKGFGAQEAKKNYLQGNAYVGVKLDEMWGMEAGYEQSNHRRHTRQVNQNDQFFGLNIPTFTPSFDATTQTAIRGVHANLIGFFKISEEYPLQLVASAGMARLRMKTIVDATDAHREFKKSKWIPRATLGLQYHMTDELGIRASLGWEKTSSFKNMKPATVDSNARVSVKDTLIPSIGLSYQF